MAQENHEFVNTDSIVLAQIPPTRCLITFVRKASIAAQLDANSNVFINVLLFALNEQK